MLDENQVELFLLIFQNFGFCSCVDELFSLEVFRFMKEQVQNKKMKISLQSRLKT